MKAVPLSKAVVLLIFVCSLQLASHAQLKKIYIDADYSTTLKKLFFYAPAEGYVAFNKFIGYTTDSGKTYTKRTITWNNVDYNGQPVNLTFGFSINGVHAFDKNNILVYGDYGLVPAILRSTDGGQTFKLVCHSPYGTIPITSIKDMVFTSNSLVGYAIDDKRVFKTTDGGQSWAAVGVNGSNAMLDQLHVMANDIFYVNLMDTGHAANRTHNGGTAWLNIPKPRLNGGKIAAMYFISDLTGWLNMYDAAGNGYLYKTTDGGSSWNLQNDGLITSFRCSKMRFINDNEGFAIAGNTTYRTYNSGRNWEPLPAGDKSFSTIYRHHDFQLLSNGQIWAGGYAGYLEMGLNKGGDPLPKAFLKVDTAGFFTSGQVKLVNYSRNNYSYTWLVNGVVISNDYNTVFPYVPGRNSDFVQLIVSANGHADTASFTQKYHPLISISSFTPAIGATGTEITITGEGFSAATAVSFGGTPAARFTIVSATKILATVAAGATGSVTVSNTQQTVFKEGFSYAPSISANFTVTVADTILCKSEPVFISIQQSQPGVIYTVVRNYEFTMPVEYGSAEGDGGTIIIKTLPLNETASLVIRADRKLIPATYFYPGKINLKVEKTTSVFTANRVNIVAGEPVSFYSQSREASQLKWTFHEDASVQTSANTTVPQVTYATAGRKTLTLVSTSAYGCMDTLVREAVFVYDKSVLSPSCYVHNVDDSDFAHPFYPAKANQISVANDNGYFVSGVGNRTVLKTNAGSSKRIEGDDGGYAAKYTPEGVLSWLTYIREKGAVSYTAVDKAGNVYVAGVCNVLRYLTLPNGDSIRIGATPGDSISYYGSSNGFIMKLTAEGQYLWHTVLDDPTREYSGYQVQGGLPERMQITEDGIFIIGSFWAKLSYWKNNVEQSLVSLPHESYPFDMQNNFILKIDSDGNLLWHMYMESESNNQMRAITGFANDKENNLYVMGNYEQQVTINDVNKANTVEYKGIGGKKASFLVKFSSDGRLLWSRNAAPETNIGSFDVRFASLAVTDNGDCYVAGTRSFWSDTNYMRLQQPDGVILNLKAANNYLIRFDAAGKLKWLSNHHSGETYAVPSVFFGKDYIQVNFQTGYNPDYVLPRRFVSPEGDSVSYVVKTTGPLMLFYDTTGTLQRIANPDGSMPCQYVVQDKEGNYLFSGVTTRSNGARPYFQNALIPTNGNDAIFYKLNNKFCTGITAVAANAGSDKLVCSGDSVVIGKAGETGLSYSWNSYPKGFRSVLPNPKVAPLQTTHYFLSVVNADGFIARDTVIVTVPVKPAETSTTKNSCAGTKTVIGRPPLPGITYSWTSAPAGFTSSDANPEVTPSTSTVYYLSYSAEGGCSGKDTVRVNVQPLITPSVKLSSSDTTICQGSTLFLQALPMYGGNTPAYQWLLNNTDTGNNSNGLTVTVSEHPVTVKLIMISSETCVTNALATTTIIVTPRKLTPKVTVGIPQTILCKGGSVICNAIVENGGSAPSFQWNYNGINVGENKSAYTIASLQKGDSIAVTVISNELCAIPASAQAGLVLMVQEAHPVVSIAGNSAVIGGQQTSLAATVADAGTQPVFQWQDSTLSRSWFNIPGAEAAAFIYRPARTGDRIRCLLTSNATCAAGNPVSSNVLVFTVNSADNEYGVLSYPNPVSGTVFVDNLQAVHQWEQLEVRALNGARYLVQSVKGQTKVPVNLTNLPAGMYIIYLKSAGGFSTSFKIIKQ